MPRSPAAPAQALLTCVSVCVCSTRMYTTHMCVRVCVRVRVQLSHVCVCVCVCSTHMYTTHMFVRMRVQH